MSFTALFPEGPVMLATAQRVFAASEVEQLTSAADVLARLNEVLGERERALRDACEVAREEGLAAGMAEGREQAREKLATALLNIEKVMHKERDTLREACAELAVSIVRRMGLQQDAPDQLLRLARQCALDCSPDHPVALHVCLAEEDDVRNRLEQLTDAERQGFLRVVGDASLTAGECVLRSRYGSIHAGLEAQLAVIARGLADD